MSKPEIHSSRAVGARLLGQLFRRWRRNLILLMLVLMAATGWRYVAQRPTLEQRRTLEPLQAQLVADVLPNGHRSHSIRLTESPCWLRNGDIVEISGTLSRPAYAYIFWIGSSGEVRRLFPGHESGELSPVSTVNLSAETGGYEVTGSDGTESVVLVATESQFPTTTLAEICRQHKPIPALPPSSLVHDGESIPFAPATQLVTTPDIAPATQRGLAKSLKRGPTLEEVHSWHESLRSGLPPDVAFTYIAMPHSSAYRPFEEEERKPLLAARKELLAELGTLTADTDLPERARVLEKILVLEKRLSGPSDEVTVQTLRQLALLYEHLDMWNAAKEKQTEILAQRIKVNGADHWLVAGNRLRIEHQTQLAALSDNDRTRLAKALDMEQSAAKLADQDRYDEALALIQEALNTRMELLGKDNLVCAKTLGIVAVIRGGQRNWDAAVQASEEAVAILRRRFGQDHPDVAQQIDNLAMLYFYADRFDEAERSFREALRMYTNTYGEKNANTADENYMLGRVFLMRGDFTAAKPYLESALQTREQLLKDHLDTAFSAYNLGWAVQQSQDFAAARPHYEKALRIFERCDPPKRGFKAGEYYFALGTIHSQFGNLVKALTHLNKALEVRQQFAGDSAATAHALNDLACVYGRMGDRREAITRHERALAIRRTFPSRGNIAQSLYNIGYERIRLGEYDAARQGLEQALEIEREVYGREHARTARTLDQLAVAHRHLGNTDLALTLGLEAYDIQNKLHGSSQSEKRYVAANLAFHYAQIGDESSSRKYIDLAVTDWLDTDLQNLSADEQVNLIEMLVHLGHLLMRIGDDSAARICFQRTVTAAGLAFGDVRTPSARLGADLGYVHYVLGNKVEAKMFLQLALDAARLSGEQGVEARALHNLGCVFIAAEDYVPAKENLEKALDLKRCQDPVDEISVSSTLHAMGLLYFKTRAYGDATRSFEGALSLRVKCPSQEMECSQDLWRLGDVSFVDGKSDAARLYYDKALDRQLDYSRRLVPALSETESLAHVKTIYMQRDRLLSLLEAGANMPVESVYSQVWRTRAFATRVADARSKWQKHMRPEELELVKKLNFVKFELASSFHLASADGNTETLANLVRTTEQLEREVGFAMQEQMRREEDMTPERLASSLPEDAAFVDIVRSEIVMPDEDKGLADDARYEAFVVRRGNDQVPVSIKWISLGPADAIDSVVSSLRDDIVARKQMTEEAGSFQMRQLVWEKIDPHVSGCTRIILTPDGALTGVPWGALPGKTDGSYLLEEYAFVLANHGQEVCSLLERDWQPGEDRLLLVGGVDYDRRPANESRAFAAMAQRGPADNGGSWMKLKSTADEVNSIAQLWTERGPLVKLTGYDAGEVVVGAEMLKARYIHLATHGYFAGASIVSALQQDPVRDTPVRLRSESIGDVATVGGRHPLLLSGVVLAGANDRTPREDGTIVHDGILTAEEVSTLDLAGADLVVLSACETGLGKVAGGEGVFGLQRAFRNAGARSVMASLWTIDDVTTQELMTEFYRNLWSAGLDKAEALRQAQIAVLKDSDRGTAPSKHRHPYYWAGFILSGDWR